MTKISDIIRSGAADESLRKQRHDLALDFARSFSDAGDRLMRDHVNGSDEVVGVSALLLIAGQLVSASADLLVQGRPYAGAALLRQIVEIEYLSWAFETRDGDAERWLQSDKTQRETFFKPAILRKAAEGKFRGQDYGYHCELGGHPVPVGTVLLIQDDAVPQLLLSDLLGHAGGIWNHFAGWARKNKQYRSAFRSDNPTIPERFIKLMAIDPLSKLPPFREEDGGL